jgi:hypothetical protein
VQKPSICGASYASSSPLAIQILFQYATPNPMSIGPYPCWCLLHAAALANHSFLLFGSSIIYTKNLCWLGVRNRFPIFGGAPLSSGIMGRTTSADTSRYWDIPIICSSAPVLFMDKSNAWQLFKNLLPHVSVHLLPADVILPFDDDIHSRPEQCESKLRMN